MNGLYLPEPHASLVSSGKKHYIAQGVDNPELCGEYLLVTGGSSDGKVLGRVNVSAGESISPGDFDSRYREHRVPAYNRKSWWPDVDILYLHEIESFEACEPVPIEVRPGVQTLMGELGLEWNDIAGDSLPRTPLRGKEVVSMPWKVFKKGEQFCVYKVDENDKPTGSSLGCHPTREAARTQQAALYASESKEMLIPEPDVLIPVPDTQIEIVVEEDVKEKWTAAYMNNLPDSSFLYVAPGGSKDDEGKTVPRSLRKLPYKDAEGKVDLPHLRNAISRLGQGSTGIPAEKKASLMKKAQGILESASKEIEEDTKVGRRVSNAKVKLLENLKAAIESFWKWAVYDDEKPEDEMDEDDDKKDYAVKVVGDYLILWPTNAFQDRELEIFTTKSIEDYVERHASDSIKGRVMYRHWKGTDFADIIFQAMSGRFLVEVAKFDDSPLGNAFKSVFSEYPSGHPEVSPEGWGHSHGYKYNPVDRQDRVYEWFDKDETSVLPGNVASNPHNPTLEVIQMNQKSIQELSALIGPDLADEVAKKGESLTEEKEKAGVAFKEAKPETAPEETVVEEVAEAAAPEPEAEAPSEEVAPNTAEPESVEPEAEKVDAGQVNVEQVVEAVTKALDVKALSDTLAAQAEAIKTLTAKVEDFTTRLATIERSDEARLEEKVKEMPRFFWQAEQPSRSKSTKIEDDDPIKAKVPVETPPAIERLAERLG